MRWTWPTKNLAAGEFVLGPCDGLVVRYSSFCAWRRLMRQTSGFDAYQQLAFDVFQLLETLNAAAAERSMVGTVISTDGMITATECSRNDVHQSREIPNASKALKEAAVDCGRFHLFSDFWGLAPSLADIWPGERCLHRQASGSTTIAAGAEVGEAWKNSEALSDAVAAADVVFSGTVPGAVLPEGWGLMELIRVKLIWSCNSHAFGADGLDCGCFPAIARSLNHRCAAVAAFQACYCGRQSRSCYWCCPPPKKTNNYFCLYRCCSCSCTSFCIVGSARRFSPASIVITAIGSSSLQLRPELLRCPRRGRASLGSCR